MRSFHRVSMMRIFGSLMALTRSRVSSSPLPTATTNSSTRGSSERMEASNGKPRPTPLRIKVKPLMETGIDRFRFLGCALEAQAVKVGVSAVILEQLCMAALLHDAAGVHHDDAV